VLTAPFLVQDSSISAAFENYPTNLYIHKLSSQPIENANYSATQTKIVFDGIERAVHTALYFL